MKKYVTFCVDTVRFALLIMGIAAEFLCSQPSDAAEIGLSMQDVFFTTPDGMNIAGSWIIPEAAVAKKTTKVPVVLLLHDYGLNRRDWSIFIPDLVQHGYGVLAIDLRGHGQSRREEATSPPTPEDVLKNGGGDLQAALNWLKSQKQADTKHVALIGAGIGGDLAFLGRSTFPKSIKVAVVISPSYSTVTEGAPFGNQTDAVLFCVSSKSKDGLSMMAAETLANFTKDPKKTIVYNSAAYGLAMFYKHPEIKQEILEWIAILKTKK